MVTRFGLASIRKDSGSSTHPPSTVTPPYASPSPIRTQNQNLACQRLETQERSSLGFWIYNDRVVPSSSAFRSRLVRRQIVPPQFFPLEAPHDSKRFQKGEGTVRTLRRRGVSKTTDLSQALPGGFKIRPWSPDRGQNINSHISQRFLSSYS